MDHVREYTTQRTTHRSTPHSHQQRGQESVENENGWLERMPQLRVRVRKHLRVCECNRGLAGQGQSRARERSSTGQSRARVRSTSEALPGVDAADDDIQLLEGSHVNVPAGFQTLWCGPAFCTAMVQILYFTHGAFTSMFVKPAIP
jgi:hypothetical protein